MEQIVVPPRNNGKHPYRYTYDEDGGIRNVERMSSIQEATEYSNSRSLLASRSTNLSSMMWPFHHRTTSEVPSTARSSRMGGGRFRSGTWGSRNMLRTVDDTASIDQSIVPDYVINFMRGETPESLARKKEARQWGERNVTIIPRRDTFSSHLVELSNHFTSVTAPLRSVGGSDGSRRRGGFLAGWRGGVVYLTLLAFLILVVGVVGLALVVTKTGEFAGQLAIYSGPCFEANRLNIGLHAAVNVFTVVLLASANYVFQVLTSPTRKEVSTAHDRRRWLDIGVASLRNLLHVSVFRSVMACLTLLVAIAIQVIFNAVIFLSQDPQGDEATMCTVSVDGPVLAIAALLNLVLVIAMAAILARPSFDPLVTLGDAVRSFLCVPDTTTAGASLLTKADVDQGRWSEGEEATKRFASRSHYWLEAPSLRRWVLTVLSWLVVAGPTAAAIALMARASSSGVATPFGTATPETIYSFPAAASIDVTRLALITPLPQLLLSVLYLAVNSLLTTYFLSRELANFALLGGDTPRRSSLRVSSAPKGTQNASLYLSLPRPVSWFLLTIFAGLGTVLSQAVFPLVMKSSSPISLRIAFNTLALLILIALLAVVLFAILALGFRRTPSPTLIGETETKKGNPLALAGRASCSALIAARCHAARGEGEPWLGPLVWGVVEEATASYPGRCAFTGGNAGSLDAEREYA